MHGKISFLFLSFFEVGGVTNNIACNLERRFNSETSLKKQNINVNVVILKE